MLALVGTSLQQQQQLNEATMMARNRNMLAQKTVHCLEFITTDCRRPFVIPTMVDRMAAMLNYVLTQLVGPKSRELRVSELLFNTQGYYGSINVHVHRRYFR